MSRDEPLPPAVAGEDQEPEPGGPDSPPQVVDGMTLRRQVLELINDVLTDTAPEGEWARTQLRDLLAADPDEPERALLQHLMAVTTADLTDSLAESPIPHRQLEPWGPADAYHPPVSARVP